MCSWNKGLPSTRFPTVRGSWEKCLRNPEIKKRRVVSEICLHVNLKNDKELLPFQTCANDVTEEPFTHFPKAGETISRCVNFNSKDSQQWLSNGCSSWVILRNEIHTSAKCPDWNSMIIHKQWTFQKFKWKYFCRYKVFLLQTLTVLPWWMILQGHQCDFKRERQVITPYVEIYRETKLTD